jgi:hypothetical protein
MTLKFNNAVMNTAITKLLTPRYFQEWVIYNKNTDTDNQFLICIKDILNKQLDRLNAITVNLYAELNTKTGVKQFTVESLNNMFNGNYSTLRLEEIIDIFKEILDINIYIITIDSNDNTIVINPNNENPLLQNNDNNIFLLQDRGYYYIIGNFEGICMFYYDKILFFNLLYNFLYGEDSEELNGPDGPDGSDGSDGSNGSKESDELSKSLSSISKEDSESASSISSISEDLGQKEIQEQENEETFALVKQKISKLTSNQTLKKLINTLDGLKESINPEKKTRSDRIIKINPDTLPGKNREIFDTEEKIQKKVRELMPIIGDENDLALINNFFEDYIGFLENTLTNVTESGILNAVNIKKYLDTLSQLEYSLDSIKKIKKYTDIINDPALEYLNQLNDTIIKEKYKDANEVRDIIDKKISELDVNQVIAIKLLNIILSIRQGGNIDPKKKDELKFMKKKLDKYYLANQTFLEGSKLDHYYNAIDELLSDQDPTIANLFVGGSSVELDESDSDSDSVFDKEFVSSFFGGARERPSKEYYNYAQQNNPYPMQRFYGQQPNPYPNPYGQPPPINPYGQPPPINPYGQPPPINPYGQPPPINPYGQPPINPYGQPPPNSYPNPYPNSYGQPPPNPYDPYAQQNLDYYNHNFQYNFAKENKSKLSYYITVELELYPGTDVSAIKKYAMKCNGTFEKIRKSLADLFGYQYRPRELKEAYEYEANFEANEKIKEENEKKLEEDKKAKERAKEREERDKERAKYREERAKKQEERYREDRSRERRRGGKLNNSFKKQKTQKNKTLKKNKYIK